MPRNNSKEVEISNRSTITKSNEFSMAKLNSGLTLNQTQLLMYAILSTQNHKNSVRSTFKKADFERQFELARYLTNDASKDSKKLISLSFSTQDLDSDKFAYYNVFQYIEYNSGLFTFEWTNHMIPHILELKDRYVETDLELTSQFTSAFSWTLYDYLKANYGKWYKYLSKDVALKLFGVESKKSYISNTSLFKKNVLDMAIEEINKLTELEVAYEDKKEGRSITGFVLKWSIGKTNKAASVEQRDQISLYINTVFEDLMKYMAMKDADRLMKARELILKLEHYKQYMDPNTKLSVAKANKYISEIAPIFNELEALVERDKRGIAEFYDWLSEEE